MHITMPQLKMPTAKLLRIASVILVIGLFAGIGCSSGEGDTGGGAGTANGGTPLVDNGGFGARLVIDVEDDLVVGGTAVFTVTALDPLGGPLSFIRIFCETEKGIAILEPSAAGVAFEHTNASGIMSGVLGGVTAGSFLIECRGPQGFNLLVRDTLGITGEGAAEFFGAAGGNLGGGLLTEAEDLLDDTFDVFITQVIFSTIGGEDAGPGEIDTFQTVDCDADGTTNDFELFGPDEVKLTIQNNRDENIFVQSINITVEDGRPAVLTTQSLNAFVAGGGGTTEVIARFTEVLPGGKFFASSPSFDVIEGTYNVTFVVTMRGESGQVISDTATVAATFANFNNACTTPGGG